MSERRQDPGIGPSWDDGRVDAPARPVFRTSLPEATPVPRPRHVMIALGLVVGAVAAFVAVTGLAALDHATVRADLVAGLPAQSEDYTDEQVERAVWVLLGAVAGVGALLSLAQAVTMRTTAMSRKLSSRTTFVTVTVLYLPVAVVAWAIRGADRVDTVLSALNVLLLLAATIVVTRQPVSAWLRQKERSGRAPLVPPAPGDELTPAAAGRRPLQTGTTQDEAAEDAEDADGRELEANEGMLSLGPGDGDDRDGDDSDRDLRRD